MSSKYEILNPFGETPFGTLFRGYNIDLDIEVAILQFHQGIREDADRFAEIWQNIKPVCQLKHDHLIPVLDVDKSHGIIILESCGGTLADRIANVSLPQNEARIILRHILEVLSFFETRRFAHGNRNRFVHGNISPATLWLPGDPDQELMRYKLAFSPGLFIGDEIFLGNRSSKHFAPEMIKPDEFGGISCRTDLYCLAFTLFESLVGRQRFDDHFFLPSKDVQSLWYVWHSDKSHPLPEPRELLPSLADDLNHVLVALLRRNAENRPGSASEVLAMLTPDAGPDRIAIPHLEPQTELADALPQPNVKIPKIILSSGVSSLGKASVERKKSTPKEKVTSAVPPGKSARPTSSSEQTGQPQLSGLSGLKQFFERLFASEYPRYSTPWFREMGNKPVIAVPILVLIFLAIGTGAWFMLRQTSVTIMLPTIPENVQITVLATRNQEKNESQPLQRIPDAADLYSILPETYQFDFTLDGYETVKLILDVDSSGKIIHNNTPLELPVKLTSLLEIQRAKTLSQIKERLEAAAIKVNQKEYEEAIKDYDWILAVDSLDSDKIVLEKETVPPLMDEAKKQWDIQLFVAHVTQGRKNLQAKQFIEAKTEFEAAIFLQPNIAEPHYYLAFAFSGLDDYSRSADEMDLAIQYDTSYEKRLPPRNPATLEKIEVRAHLSLEEQEQRPGGGGLEILEDWESLEKRTEDFDLVVASDFNDVDFSSLRNLPRMKGLNIAMSRKVTDMGLARIKAHHQLELLAISSSGITDSGMESLVPMVQLKKLVLTGCPEITDTGLGFLKSTPQMEYLVLSGSSFSDKTLVEISKLEKLSYLSLWGSSGITDRGIARLSSLKKLRFLDLNDCEKLTPEGIESLRAVLPECRILPQKQEQ